MRPIREAGIEPAIRWERPDYDYNSALLNVFTESGFALTGQCSQEHVTQRITQRTGSDFNSVSTLACSLNRNQ